MLKFSRRTLIAQLAMAPLVASPFVSSLARAATPLWTARQYHNQPEGSPLHTALVALWNGVKKETMGKLDVTVYPQNNGIAGSDPAALKLLRENGLEFYTLMGGILSNAVPVMDVQGLPFVYTSAAQIHAMNDGPLGRYLDSECLSKGIVRVKGGLFENGFRHLDLVSKPVASIEDMAGLKIRVPDGNMFRDFFTTIGAQPVTLNINKLYAALKEGAIDGQENPLVIVETNKLFEVTKYISMSGHMWSGFNLLANGEFWNRLPRPVQLVIERYTSTSVARQRRTTADLNRQLEAKLQSRGMIFNTPQTQGFREKLAAEFYPRWKAQLGERTWALIETGLRKPVI